VEDDDPADAEQLPERLGEQAVLALERAIRTANRSGYRRRMQGALDRAYEALDSIGEAMVAAVDAAQDIARPGALDMDVLQGCMARLQEQVQAASGPLHELNTFISRARFEDDALVLTVAAGHAAEQLLHTRWA
jgi:hypothetical protein